MMMMIISHRCNQKRKGKIKRKKLHIHYYNGNIEFIQTFITLKWCCPWGADTFQSCCGFELIIYIEANIFVFRRQNQLLLLLLNTFRFFPLQLYMYSHRNVTLRFWQEESIFTMSIKIVCFQYIHWMNKKNTRNIFRKQKKSSLFLFLWCFAFIFS